MSNSAFSCLLDDKLAGHIDVFESFFQDEGLKKAVAEAAEIVLRVVLADGAVYLCGNGGSAADAQHIATEFVSRFYRERRAINAEALTVNTSSLTAIANDYDYDRVFARQLEAKGKPGDVLIGISTSGTSKNVMEAIKFAASHKIHTILLTGARRNEYDTKLYECVLQIPSVDTPRIQEGHIFIGHMLAEYVERYIAEEV